MGCSTLQAFKSPSGNYHKYVDKNLKVERIFDRGRELFVAKILPVTDKLIAEQELLSPIPRAHFKPGHRQIVMALNVSGREAMNLDNWQFKLDGSPSVSMEEIVDAEVIEREYYFGYPFYRIFVVNFSAAQSVAQNSQSEVAMDAFEILSPYGKMAVRGDFFLANRATAGESK